MYNNPLMSLIYRYHIIDNIIIAARCKNKKDLLKKCWLLHAVMQTATVVINLLGISLDILMHTLHGLIRWTWPCG